MTTETNHAIDNARGHLESIRDLMARLNGAPDVNGEIDYVGECRVLTTTERETIEQEINEQPLSVLVRSPWRQVGERDESASEYEILLTTGGPALRIVGEIGSHGEPENARMEWQDWGTPWTELHGADMPDELLPSEWDAVLLAFARCFYFEEG